PRRSGDGNAGRWPPVGAGRSADGGGAGRAGAATVAPRWHVGGACERARVGGGPFDRRRVVVSRLAARTGRSPALAAGRRAGVRARACPCVSLGGTLEDVAPRPGRRGDGGDAGSRRRSGAASQPSVPGRARV